MKCTIVALSFFLMIPALALAQDAAAPAVQPPIPADQLRDATEGMKLLPVQMQIMKIAFAARGGDTAGVQKLIPGAMSEINKVLAENPDSIAGLHTRCQLRNILEQGGGKADCEQG